MLVITAAIIPQQHFHGEIFHHSRIRKNSRDHHVKASRLKSAYQWLPGLWGRKEPYNASASTKGVILLGLTTAMRIGVIRKTRQKHIDFNSRLWLIPVAENQDVEYRMKSGREFQIGLPTILTHALKELLKLDCQEKSRATPLSWGEAD